MVRHMKASDRDHIPPVEILWNNYDYSFLTGELISKRTGKPLSINKRLRNHYVTLTWSKDGAREQYATTVARIVVAWIIGEWPDLQVDHINRDTSDNRWSNLRLVTPRQNCINRSTFKGGIDQRPSGNWRARVRAEGKQITIGTFPTKEDALFAYETFTLNL